MWHTVDEFMRVLVLVYISRIARTTEVTLKEMGNTAQWRHNEREGVSIRTDHNNTMKRDLWA